jgi:hypothetical protein
MDEERTSKCQFLNGSELNPKKNMGREAPLVSLQPRSVEAILHFLSTSKASCAVCVMKYCNAKAKHHPPKNNDTLHYGAEVVGGVRVGVTSNLPTPPEPSRFYRP